jgi:hypothetical protein
VFLQLVGIRDSLVTLRNRLRGPVQI